MTTHFSDATLWKEDSRDPNPSIVYTLKDQPLKGIFLAVPLCTESSDAAVHFRVQELANTGPTK